MKQPYEYRTRMWFPWEQKEHQRQLAELHVQRDRVKFLRESFSDLAMRLNKCDVEIAGPVVAAEILDMLDDCFKQVFAPVETQEVCT